MVQATEFIQYFSLFMSPTCTHLCVCRSVQLYTTCSTMKPPPWSLQDCSIAPRPPTCGHSPPTPTSPWQPLISSSPSSQLCCVEDVVYMEPHRTELFGVSFFFFLISWRLITLQYCSGFCHTLT